MITPFQIYMLMSADDIKIGLLLIAVIISVCVMFVLIDEGKLTQKCRKWLLAAGFIFTASMLLPCTKTLLAMYVVPKIVNNEQLKGEAVQLYELYKQTLQEKTE